MRCLIVGCGCRGLALARALREAGCAVRGTTREPARLAALAAAGVQPSLADPNRPATLLAALEHVSVIYLLLGSVDGDAEAVAALHGQRLEALLTALVDTTVRGLVYEAAGTAPPEVLDRGARLVRAVAARARLSHAVLDADPDDRCAWLAQARVALATVVGR